MARRKTKTRFFTIGDYVEIEKWLEENHRNGWKLVKSRFPCFFIFEECKKEDSNYRLDFKNEKVTEDYVQMYKDYGWEYIGSCFGWNYFRKININDDSEAEKEIFSDSESKLNMINHIFKTRMFPSLTFFFIAIGVNGLRLTNDTHRTVDIYSGVFLLILFLIYLFAFVHCLIKLKRLKKELER